jgi:hypothetical protein
MPSNAYYDGLSLADAIARFADYHSDPDTRHISQYEYELLQKAATALRSGSDT